MLKLYAKHGMVVEKVPDITLKQSRWLKSYIDFNTIKRALVKTEIEKHLSKGMNCPFYGYTNKNVKNRLKIYLVKKDDDGKLVKLQSKTTFTGNHKPYDKHYTYTSKQKDNMMDKPM